MIKINQISCNSDCNLLFEQIINSLLTNLLIQLILYLWLGDHDGIEEHDGTEDDLALR